MKTNIHIQELEKALKFAKSINEEVITLELISNPIGCVIKVSKDFDSKQKDITNYDCW